MEGQSAVRRVRQWATKWAGVVVQYLVVQLVLLPVHLLVKMLAVLLVLVSEMSREIEMGSVGTGIAMNDETNDGMNEEMIHVITRTEARIVEISAGKDAMIANVIKSL